MNVQLDLFAWADARPSTIIDAREKFDRRAVDLAIALAVGHVPFRNGEVVAFARRASAGAPRSASSPAAMQAT
ncbi:hypothetical protein G6L34_02030 [Agrobacterium tumefaciens]|uniref:hypothetical protein n=1 Tax=Agrobacterium tumefaciens TaxID=358 RepID=UPI0015741CE9|nr:hypothetical protein [Agrobacterium tumefaciens]NTA46871.1 hypothetical protein [Agrobacterium tumefaciens]